MVARPVATQGKRSPEAQPQKRTLFPNPFIYANILPRSRMTRQQILDLYFMDARAKLLDIAAFMDRVDRAQGEEDFRMQAFRKTLAALNEKKNRAEKVLLSLSDPTKEPIPAATTKAAAGAYPGPVKSTAKSKR
jgi:hypothetical protein